MSQKLTTEAMEVRRTRILDAARWCFLNFGFSRTSLEEVARRASLSRTSLYQVCRDKEDLFIQVFDDWLLTRLPAARAAAATTGSARARLQAICQVMLLDLWSEMEVAPMAGEFHDVCERLGPQAAQRHRDGMLQCVARVLGDPEVSLVFLLALEGLLADRPTLEILAIRVGILVNRFTEPVR